MALGGPRAIVLALAALLGATTACRHTAPPTAASKPITVQDDFESSTLAPHWNRDKFEPGAIQIQTDHIRSGRSAGRVTLWSGAKLQTADGLGPTRPNERAELTERKDLFTREGESVRYAFSFLVPTNFPIVPIRLILAQWKQRDGGTALVNNPVLALRYVAGELSLTLQTGHKKASLFSTQALARGTWHDFVLESRFDRTTNGFVHAWLDGNPIAKFHGATAYAADSGYPDDGEIYFKLGLYRDSMLEPMTLYVDRYEKRWLNGARR